MKNKKPEVTAEELSARVTASRERLAPLVDELKERWNLHRVVKRAIRNHPARTAGGALLVMGLIGGGVGLAVQRRRRRQRVVPHLGRLRLAAVRAFRNPDQVARNEPDLGGKIFAAAATTVTGVVLKNLLQKLLQSARAPAS